MQWSPWNEKISSLAIIRKQNCRKVWCFKCLFLSLKIYLWNNTDEISRLVVAEKCNILMANEILQSLQKIVKCTLEKVRKRQKSVNSVIVAWRLSGSKKTKGLVPFFRTIFVSSNWDITFFPKLTPFIPRTLITAALITTVIITDNLEKKS